MSRKLFLSSPSAQSPAAGRRRPFWITILLASMLAFVAYVVATVLFIVITQLSLLPQGPLWDPSLRGPMIFVMIIIVVSVLLVPLFMTEADRIVRVFSALVAFVVVVYAVFHHSPAFDPERPMRFIVTYIFTPFQNWIGGR